PAGKPAAKDGFAKVQAAAAAKDPELLDVLLPGRLVEQRRGLDADGVKAWRDGFARALGVAKLLDAREDGDDAVARLETGSGEGMLPLHFGGTRWVVAAA